MNDMNDGLAQDLNLQTLAYQAKTLPTRPLGLVGSFLGLFQKFKLEMQTYNQLYYSTWITLYVIQKACLFHFICSLFSRPFDNMLMDGSILVAAVINPTAWKKYGDHNEYS